MDMENRKRYIREVLDEDMNMKQRVVDLNRYRVMGIVDEVTPYVQIDQDEINKMRVAAATLSQVLEKKALLANQIRSGMDEDGVNANIIDLAHTEEVISAYNAVVTIYLNPRNTQETRSYISQILTSFEGKVSEIHDNMQDIIANMKTLGRPHVASMIYAFSLFGLLRDQLANSNFHVIYMSDLRVANELRQKDTGPSQQAAAPMEVDAPGSGPGAPPGPGGPGPAGPRPDGPRPEGPGPGEPRPGEPRPGGSGPSGYPRWPPGASAYDSMTGPGDGYHSVGHEGWRGKDFRRNETPYGHIKVSRLGRPFFDTSQTSGAQYFKIGSDIGDVPPHPGAASSSGGPKFEYQVTRRTGAQGDLTVATMNDAITAYNKQNKNQKLKFVDTGPASDRKQRLRAFVSKYITFRNSKGDVINLSGSGMPGDSDEDMSSSGTTSDEEIPTIAPVAPFNDVRNDPYFVMR